MLLSRLIIAGVFAGAVVVAGDARAAFILSFNQVGQNVVATGSGSLDLTDLTLGSNPGTWAVGAAYIRSANGDFGIAPVPHGQYGLDQWLASVTGPASFGTGSYQAATSETGTSFFFYGGGNSANMYLSQSYVSGSSMTDSMTFDNATFATLGVTPGTYTWTWGTGGHADYVQVNVSTNVPTVPEPSGLACLAGGLIAIGYACTRRRSVGASG